MLCQTALAAQVQAPARPRAQSRPSTHARARLAVCSRHTAGGLWRRLKSRNIAVLRAAPDSHPIVPNTADDASAGVSVDIADAVEADIRAAERAAAAADAEDATVASEAATAEVTDDAQAAAAAAEQTAVGGQAQVAPPSLLQPRQWYASQGRQVQIGIGGVAAFAGITLLIAIVRTVKKFRSPRAKRKRTVNSNKTVVEGIDAYLPDNQVLRGLRMKTGFSAVEVFRKYLWYALRERKFDADTVADLVHLREQLDLSDDQTAEALQERAKRIYEKYGNVMLDVGGMTKAGIERKATCRALFSKLLYLAESEELAPSLSGPTRRSCVQDVFGATDADCEQLRIVSLYDVDLDAMDALATGADAPGASDQPGSPTAGDE